MEEGEGGKAASKGDLSHAQGGRSVRAVPTVSFRQAVRTRQLSPSKGAKGRSGYAVSTAPVTVDGGSAKSAGREEHPSFPRGTAGVRQERRIFVSGPRAGCLLINSGAEILIYVAQPAADNNDGGGSAQLAP